MTQESVSTSLGGIAEPQVQAHAIGIDFGTTYSVLSYLDATAEVCLIPDATGSPLIASAVTLLADGITVGNRAGSDESRTIRSPKRLIGLQEADYAELAIPHQVHHDSERGAVIEVEGVGSYDATQICTAIFDHLRQVIELHLGAIPEHVVITVPARFGEDQRQFVQLAARAAGIEPSRLVVEPTAAAVAYGNDVPEGDPVLIYDFGGGTFDASIVERTGDMYEVLATSGDTVLGGDDIDTHIVRLWEQVAEVPSATGALLAQRLRSAQMAKERLSHEEEVVLECQDTPSVSFTRESLTYAASEVVQRTINIARDACGRLPAGKAISCIHLVGGSSQLVGLAGVLEAEFQVPVLTSPQPQLMVAQGAAFLAESLNRQRIKVMDVVPLDVGVETAHGITDVLIARGTALPVKVRKTFTNASSKQTSMKFHLVQGQRELAENNVSLGSFSLRNLPQVLAGTLRIDLDVELDVAGNLNVSATHAVPGGVTSSITIEQPEQRPLHEVAALLHEAIRHQADDRSARTLREAAGLLEESVIQLEEALVVDSDLIDAELQGVLQQELEQARSLIGSENLDELRAGIKRLEEAAEPLATARLQNALAVGLVGASVEELKNAQD